MYEGLLGAVAIVGKGTFDDPRRPMYAPAPSTMQPTSRAGIIGFSFIESDDKKSALVEFVAVNKAAFQPMLGHRLLDRTLAPIHKPKLGCPACLVVKQQSSLIRGQ